MNSVNTGMNPAYSVQGAQANSKISPADRLKLREAAADFESMFVKQMLSSMRKAIPKEDGGLIKESEGEKIFRDLLDAEYAKTTSRSGQGLGLGAAMYRQLVARYGLESQTQGQRTITVEEARQSLQQLHQDNSAMSAAGQGRLGQIGRNR
ncbi:MAG: rod-binding protein [Magnetococcales bacterium]|nr:rod-binding protein [Magnetococcales bacterium]